MNKTKQGPKKGAAKKWSERLKKIGEKTPPEDLMKILNETEKPAKSATPQKPPSDLEI
ncbi:MAG: hypothetical protein J0M15_13395 [Deltaproteobacteria bacterium]|jgi:hypothetical protein|nr:hypothetical protein [Deltaproteobacteria bacterium]